MFFGASMELGQEFFFSMKWNQNWNDSKSEDHTTSSETPVVGDNHGLPLRLPH
jgi:hypothetical protein